MIAYHILCHNNFEQVAMMIDSLYTSEDVYLIDIDDGANPDTQPLERFKSCSNIHIIRDSNIGWGGAGTLRKTIKGALFLLDADKLWDYYVVLSGQDLPLKPVNAIKSRLALGLPGKISFIRASKPDLVCLDDIPVNNKKSSMVMWNDRGHTRIFAKPGTIDPQVAFGARWLVDVTEIGEKGEVYVGICDALLLKRREAFFARYPFHVGANWFNLHRSVLEYLKNDDFAYELYDVMRNSFIPDESFFQTYLKNSPFRDQLDSDYGRLILRPGPVPRVKVFDMQDWPTIESANELFGRKFDLSHDKKVVRAVLEQAA